MEEQTITILGAGAMGAALSVPLSDNNHQVRIWGTSYDREILDAVTGGEAHPRLDATLPADITWYREQQLQEALQDADIVVLGVNSAGLPPVLEQAIPMLTGDELLVSITKGFVDIQERAFPPGEGMQYMLDQVEGRLSEPEIVQIAGPSIAAELAQRSHTAVVFASEQLETAHHCRDIFRTPYYHLQVTNDVKGVDLCLALKNLYSIALAWPVGLSDREEGGSRSNLQAILFQQALRELKILVETQGGEPQTVYGLAALGDFVVTSEAGRNGRFGRLLGQGYGTQEAYEQLQEQGVGTVEGYEIADAGKTYLEGMENGVFELRQVPLLQGIFDVLLDGATVDEALAFLDE